MVRTFVEIIGVVVLFSILTGVIELGSDKGKQRWNICRDAGGSIVYCFTGLR